VNGVRFPEGLRLERLRRDHPRRAFHCGEAPVDEWLATKALQHQDKHLSVTKVLLDEAGAVAGYFTLATGQVDFGDLPAEVARRLPRRLLPVAVLAWLGVSIAHQGRGLGRLLLVQALRDCHEAGKTFAFIAVILDCVSDAAKAFYRQWDFAELPGHPYRLFLSAKRLASMAEGTEEEDVQEEHGP
jgi:GNAT superfamily N-acetyltransferase